MFEKVTVRVSGPHSHLMIASLLTNVQSGYNASLVSIIPAQALDDRGGDPVLCTDLNEADDFLCVVTLTVNM